MEKENLIKEEVEQTNNGLEEVEQTNDKPQENENVEAQENENVANSIDELINAFRNQEDEIKEKLKNKIEYKNNNEVKSNFAHQEQDTNIPKNMDNISGDLNATSKNESFKITGDSSNLSTTSLKKEEDIYFEDLVTIAERVGENSVILKHVDRATLKDLEEDKDYAILLEWDNFIPNDARIEDIDNIFKNGLDTFVSNVKNKEELLFNSLVIKKDNWVENLEEDKKDYLDIADYEKKNLNVIDEEILGTNVSVLSISDILNQRNNIIEKDDDLTFEDNNISNIDDDLAGLEDFFGTNVNEDENSNLISNTLEEDALLLDNLETKSTEDLLQLKDKLHEKTSNLLVKKQESLDKVEEYSFRAETIENILRGHAQREDGTLYLGKDFFNKYTIEEQGEVLKDFTFKAFQDVNTQIAQDIKDNEINNSVNQEEDNEVSLNNEKDNTPNINLNVARRM